MLAFFFLAIIQGIWAQNNFDGTWECPVTHKLICNSTNSGVTFKTYEFSGNLSLNMGTVFVNGKESPLVFPEVNCTWADRGLLQQVLCRHAVAEANCTMVISWIGRVHNRDLSKVNSQVAVQWLNCGCNQPVERVNEVCSKPSTTTTGTTSSTTGPVPTSTTGRFTSTGHATSGHTSTGRVTTGHTSTGRVTTGHSSTGRVTTGHSTTGRVTSTGHSTTGTFAGKRTLSRNNQ
eukprot:TRINITY_DN339_c0_g1_i1.p1 TRINITY_DN339_c0_g1~~TRINITY_DN339_c0_g1_i1.p1  ORF type:complete len:233 (-),score=38.31 TRINITY_DN339_c0_g1_i1:57-755(-)